jgi:hypothetical protein
MEWARVRGEASAQGRVSIVKSATDSTTLSDVSKVAMRAHGKCGLCGQEHITPDSRWRCTHVPTAWSTREEAEGADAPLCVASLAKGKDFNRRGLLVHTHAYVEAERSTRLRFCCVPALDAPVLACAECGDPACKGHLVEDRGRFVDEASFVPEEALEAMPRPVPKGVIIVSDAVLAKEGDRG